MDVVAELIEEAGDCAQQAPRYDMAGFLMDCAVEVTRLQRIVDALAACDPVAVDCSAWCPLCEGGGADDEDVYSREDVVHKPDCPWVLAQAARSK